MKNCTLKASSLVFLLVLMQVCQLVMSYSATMSTHLAHDLESYSVRHDGGRIISRRLLVSEMKTLVSGNVDKLTGSMMKPEKAVANGLREQPRSSPNPIQNK